MKTQLLQITALLMLGGWLWYVGRRIADGSPWGKYLNDEQKQMTTHMFYGGSAAMVMLPYLILAHGMFYHKINYMVGWMVTLTMWVPIVGVMWILLAVRQDMWGKHSQYKTIPVETGTPS